MKKIVSSILLFLFSALFSTAQVIYTNKEEYQKALKDYNDALDSYNNFIKKVKFYGNYKFPKSNSYPENGDAWMTLIKPDLNKLGIKVDNEEQRLHPNVKSSGLIYFNFIEVSDLDFLQVKITNQPISKFDYKFSARTLKFVHPGKPPVYSEIKEKPAQKNIVKEIKKEDSILKDTTIIKEKNMVYVGPVKEDTYFMPDGKKYTYEQLIKSYPIFKNDLAMKVNFKK